MRDRVSQMSTSAPESSLPPYETARDALADLADIPPDILRQLAAGVLRIINDEQPGVARAAAQLRARAAVAAMLISLAADAESTIANRTFDEPRYFGRRPWGPGVDDRSRMGPTPIGERCLRCDEGIRAGDAGVVMAHVGANGAELRAQHRECFLRSVFGSAAHIEKRCTCFGGSDDDGDPPELSKREAARLACKLAGVALEVD